MVLGAPMGVCVNCAAPIAKGMFSGGMRAETMLSAMISSPTLNVIVLTMAFSILPFYLAITKFALSMIVIIIGVPVLCRLLPAKDLQLPPDDQRRCALSENLRIEERENFQTSAKKFAQDFLSDLVYILKMTVPLMVLAGFLGAIVATLIPIEFLNTLKFSLIGLVLIAIVGTFLPVPIAFDVVICGALLAAGLNVGYVMTLLFTLGVISIYSLFIVTQSLSLRAAALLSILIITIGVSSGLAINFWHQHQVEKALDVLTASNTKTNSSSTQSALPSPPQGQMTKSTPATGLEGTQTAQLEIKRLPFRPASRAGEKLFTQMEAHHIGIDQPIEFSFKDMWPPFWEGRSIAAGDIDRDGDTDIVIASTRNGAHIYFNDGTGQFDRKLMALDTLKDWPVFNAALVDINNDGWLDIFLATYQKGNFVLWNDHGNFTSDNKTSVINRPDAILSLALSFGDINQDGYLDAALGNWAAGWYRRVPGEESRNRVIFNDAGKMTGADYTDLPGIPGETLSILLSDINNDRHTDLLVGNDFEIPDVYYFGDGTGNLTQIKKQDDIIPLTTTTTMAIKNHDLDNDLVPEIYLAQIAGRSSGISDRLNMQPIEQYCDNIERDQDKQICQDNMDVKKWYKAGNNFDPTYAGKCLELDTPLQAECKAMLIKDLAIQKEDPSLCGIIPQNQPQAIAYCRIHFKPARPLLQREIDESYPQIKQRNVLLKRQTDDRYRDISVERRLEVGGWSWDTKIADFDNDEWADVYIVNGTWVPNEVTPSNMYFSNNGSGYFDEQAQEAGLVDHLITAAATTLDIDHDGDLDIISVPVNGPVKIALNNSQSTSMISFQLSDEIGNYYGVGAKITITYGPDDSHYQMREIQLGGGFQSFDAPIANFGLGKHDTINSIVIDWADGSQSTIRDPLSAGATYHISRSKL